MNESSEMIHTKWNGLIDSYKKYQQNQAELTGQSGKSANCTPYHKWCWAENLEFLERCGYKQSMKYKISSTSLHECSLESRPPPGIQLVSTTSIPTISMTGPEIVLRQPSETLSKDSVPDQRSSTTARTTPAVEPIHPSDPLYKWRTSTTQRSYSKPADAGDGVDIRRHLKRAKCGDPCKAIEFLFKSYAETFKSFTVKKQVLLKITLARLFADAELDEMNEPSLLSPAASITNDHDCALGLDAKTSKLLPDSEMSSID